MSDFIINLETRNKLDEARYTLATTSTDVNNSADKVLLSLALTLGNTLSKCVITPLTITDNNSDQEINDDVIPDITDAIDTGTTTEDAADAVGTILDGFGAGGD